MLLSSYVSHIVSGLKLYQQLGSGALTDLGHTTLANGYPNEGDRGRIVATSKVRLICCPIATEEADEDDDDDDESTDNTKTEKSSHAPNLDTSISSGITAHTSASVDDQVTHSLGGGYGGEGSSNAGVPDHGQGEDSRGQQGQPLPFHPSSLIPHHPPSLIEPVMHPSPPNISFLIFVKLMLSMEQVTQVDPWNFVPKLLTKSTTDFAGKHK